MDYPLIGPEDPAPYSLYNESGAAKVLIVCDHASPAIPKRMNQLGLADWVLERHVAFDIGAAGVTRAVADGLDAPAVLSGYSRLLVDPNRPVDNATAFVQVSDGIAIPANLQLSDHEKRLRIKSFFEPYHSAIQDRLDAFRSRGVTPAVIAVHSCTPVFDRIVRRWHIGVMWDKDPRIAMPLIQELTKADGVCFGDNEPYSGRDPHDYTLDHHAEAAGLPYVGLEVRQDLVSTDAGVRQWARVLIRALKGILEDDGLYRPL
jgi:predicted N-formylglutamate amidohydrolase